MPFDRETQDQIAAVMLRHGTPEQQAKAIQYVSRTEVDAAVYECRQRGEDTTYDIVNEGIAKFLANSSLYLTHDVTREAALAAERETCAKTAERIGQELMRAGRLQAGVVSERIARAIRAGTDERQAQTGVAEPTDAQLGEMFVKDSGGPNPYFKCRVCSTTEPGLREYLASHWKVHNR